MSHQPPFDRFTLPGHIPDHDVNPRAGRDLAADGDAGGGRFPPARELTDALADGPAARGYVLAHPAGRGWEGESSTSVRVERSRDTLAPSGPEPTPTPSRKREGSETCQAAGAASRSGVGQSLANENRPGPDPLLTPALQAQFCEHLSHSGNVRAACGRVGVSPNTAYRARRASADFAACWDAALLLARKHVEQVLAERALEGVEEAVFYHGEVVATRRRYDARLLLAHLARLDRQAEESAARKGAIGEGDFDAALDALEQERELPGQGACELREEDCRACGSQAGEPCRAEEFTGEELEDRADPAHWVGGEYHAPWVRRLHAMEDARPADAPSLSSLGRYEEVQEKQLRAFEAGEPEWWLRGGYNDEEEEEEEEEMDWEADWEEVEEAEVYAEGPDEFPAKDAVSGVSN